MLSVWCLIHSNICSHTHSLSFPFWCCFSLSSSFCVLNSTGDWQTAFWSLDLLLVSSHRGSFPDHCYTLLTAGARLLLFWLHKVLWDILPLMYSYLWLKLIKTPKGQSNKNATKLLEILSMLLSATFIPTWWASQTELLCHPQALPYRVTLREDWRRTNCLVSTAGSSWRLAITANKTS